MSSSECGTPTLAEVVQNIARRCGMLDSEIDVPAMLSSTESMNRLWLHELDPAAVPRQWLRGSFEFLQAWHKVTTGTPGDWL